MIYRDGVDAGETRGEAHGIEKTRSEILRTMLAANIEIEIILKSGFTMEEIEKAR